MRTPIVCLSILLIGNLAPAQGVASAPQFPPYLGDHFDYAAFTRFDTPAPPKTLIYQSNGFMALQEKGFGGQKMIIPVAGAPVPTNSSDRLLALEMDAPVFVDASRRTYDLAGSPATRSMTYFADRTVYRARFNGGPEVLLTVYPIYGKSAAVFKIAIVKSPGPLHVILRTRGDGFQTVPNNNSEVLSYGSSRWPYRSLLAARPKASIQDGSFQWDLRTGSHAALLIALGGTEQNANATLAELGASPDLFDRSTHDSWNEYLASVPLVAPAEPVTFTIGTTGAQESIAPKELVRSELWFWHGLLDTTCQDPYLPACPLMIADWNVFMGMWSNDGIAEAIALASTNERKLARAAIVNWFRYSVNAQRDGTSAWTIFPSGNNTFAAQGPERNTQGVPVQATLVGEYIRLTGDSSILQVRPGGAAGNRTIWQALLAYQHNLLAARDPKHDGLIEWLHTYESGWDDKDSPFIDLHGDPTAAINEQIFNLWSLSEMAWLTRLQGEDPLPWEQEFTRALGIVRNKLWDPATQRYWDMDEKTGKLWTIGENLDAYYLLYFERDPQRIAAMLRRLNDPQKFNGALLPTLAFDTPHWGGYWRGPAWPRIFCYVGMALAHSGHQREGFTLLARAINSNLGPLLPENVDPKLYPPSDHAIGSVRIMGYDALDTLILPDVAGLRTWGGEDLTVVPGAALGELYIRNQKWMGDTYDAILEPDRPTRIWRNGHALPSLNPHLVWRAQKTGETVIFRSVPKN
jgi:Mannosylglycerate hydrolase MGH1-like glycoside hydrolase domain